MKVLLLIVVATLGACRDAKIPNDTLVVGIENEIKNLDIRYAADANTAHVANLITQTLIHTGDNFLPELDLAESYQNIGDKKFVFKIPSGLSFHDGTPLTTQDILYSFEQAAGPKSRIKSSFVDVEKFEANDASTFSITLKKPNSAFLLSELAAIRVFPKSVGESPGFSSHPVGSGPYRFVKRQNRDLIFERFDAYRSYRTQHGLDPRPFKKIIVRAIEDPTTRFLSLVGGDIDILFNALSPRRILEAEKITELQVQHETGINYQYLGFNLKAKKFQDVRVRRALALAINRDELIEHKLKGFARKAAGLLPPQNPFAYSGLEQMDFNPTVARRLLKEAHAESLTIEIKCSTDRDVISILQVVQKYWQDVGVAVTLRPLEFATFFAQVREGNFEAFSLRWTNITEPDILFKVFHSRELPPGRNRISYINPKIDKILEAARDQTDTTKRRNLYFEAQKILALDEPYISLWYPDNVAVLSKAVRNYKINPSGSWQGIFSARKESQP